MILKELKQRPTINGNEKQAAAFLQFSNLINELKDKNLPEQVMQTINKEIEHLNTLSDTGKGLRNQIIKTQSSIVNLLEKEVKIVVKHHYRNTWLAIGMAAFGIPLGVAFGASLGNMGLLALGIPIGMVIGIAVGTGLDKKAFEEGRQLDIELK